MSRNEEKFWMQCPSCKGAETEPCPTCHGKTWKEKGVTYPDYCNVKGCTFERGGLRNCHECEGEGIVESKTLSAEKQALLVELLKQYSAEELAENEPTRVTAEEITKAATEAGVELRERAHYAISTIIYEYNQE